MTYIVSVIIDLKLQELGKCIAFGDAKNLAEDYCDCYLEWKKSHNNEGVCWSAEEYGILFLIELRK